jgi:hypothetical protein
MFFSPLVFSTDVQQLTGGRLFFSLDVFATHRQLQPAATLNPNKSRDGRAFTIFKKGILYIA